MVEDLHHPVRDVDDGDATLGQAMHDREKGLCFLFRQRRCRFIQDEDAAVERQRLGDLDELLVGNRKLAYQRGRIDVGQFAEDLARLALQGTVIHQEAAAGVGGRHENVLGNGHVRAQGDFLVHEADAHLLGFRRRGNADRLAVEDDLAAVGLKNAVDDVHQGRLASAILAGQGVDLAAPQLEVDAAKGLDGAEGFCNPGNPQDHIVGHGFLP